jgi:hypothetical protein
LVGAEICLSKYNEIISASETSFKKRFFEIDRRLETFKMLLETGLYMIAREGRIRMPVYVLSAKSFRLIRSARQLLPVGQYESCWVLLRAAYESTILGVHLGRCQTDAQKWLEGKEIPMREIRKKGLVKTWDTLWSSLCNQAHPNLLGLPVKPVTLDGETQPFAFVLTDPPEINPMFQPEECEHILYHIDIEICKGAGLQIMLFKNRILDQSMQLSDRYAELHKHIVRILGRPDLAKQTRKIEREYGLDQFYRKGQDSGN